LLKPDEFWEQLERSVAAYGVVEVAVAEPSSAEEREKRKRDFLRLRRCLDAVALVAWIYILCRLFIFDVDRWLLEHWVSDVDSVTKYRLAGWCFLVAVSVIILRWKVLLVGVYISFFPLIVAFWKVPKAIYNRRSWLLVVAAINVAAVGLRKVGRKIVLLCVGMICVFVLTTSAWLPAVVVASALLLTILLGWYVRALKVSAMPSEFFRIQESAIERAVQFKILRDVSPTGLQLMEISGGYYPKAKIDQFSQELSWSVMANRGLYLWAYQLDRYRMSSAAAVTMVLQYVLLFVGSTSVFTLINFGLLNADHEQFTFSGSGHPSFLRTALYSMSSLALNAGAGIEADGDLAVFVRLFAGFVGVVLLAGVIMSVVMTYRVAREPGRSVQVVQRLREHAAAQERRLQETFAVSIDEAIDKLASIGNNLHGLIGWIVAAVPPAFFEEGATADSSGPPPSEGPDSEGS
jgi:hypothetical protein